MIVTDKIQEGRTARPTGPATTAGQKPEVHAETAARLGASQTQMPNGDPPALMLWGADDNAEHRKTG
jgi:hypothetical protein